MKKKETIPNLIHILLSVGLLIQVVLVFLVQGRYSFMLEDRDFLLNLSTGEELTSFGDIVASIPVLFSKVGGSTLAGALLQVVLLCGQVFANIFNTVLLLGIAFLISRTIGAKRQTLLFTAISFFFLITLNGDWAYSYFWQFGVIYYTLPALGLLGLILIYLRAANMVDGDVAGLLQVIAGVCAFFCGWMNAAYGVVGLCIVVFTILLRMRLQGRSLSKWMIGTGVCSFVGILLYFAAPGNYHAASIMRGVYLAVSTFPAVVLALLMLAILLRTGGFLKVSQIVLLLTLCVSVVLCFVLDWIPVVGANGIQMATLLLAVTLFSSLLHSMNHQHPVQWRWGYLVAGCGFVYSTLALILCLTGVM